jgi:UDP-N-acetylmuramoylalanine--D-glutamate ligase
LGADGIDVTARPKLSWSDLSGARVGVWGLGREGGANLRKLRSLSISPVLVDDHPADPSVLATEDGGIDELERCDVVVKTPGISRYRPEVARLRGRGIPVCGGLGLWLAEADRSRVVCVTGTKGKSSTVSIAGHLLTRLGHQALVGGNFGVLPYDPEVGTAYDYWVIEVSSYQATDLPYSPPVTAVTSLNPDHLPWHGGVEEYYRDKLSACSQPGAEVTIANGDSPELRSRASLLAPRVTWVSASDEPESDWMKPLGLLGAHNRRNALIARQLLAGLGVHPGEDELRAAAAGYAHLPSRLTIIGATDGVTFVDDSLSTNVLPTLAALEAFEGRRVALIVGGQDRGIDYHPLAQGVLSRGAPTLVLTLPDSGARIQTAFSDTFTEAAECHVEPVSELAQAVRAGFEWARPDGVVLLSPAAPSFGHFRDYRDRGDAFAQAFRDLTLSA